MGVDLIVLPLDHESDGWGFSHTVLSLERAGDLWPAIAMLAEQAVPASFSTYVCQEGGDAEMHYGNTQYDGYDERLCCATADALWGVRWHPGVTEAARNRAAWAYLGELPPQRRVALYWHEGRRTHMSARPPRSGEEALSALTPEGSERLQAIIMPKED